MRILLVEDAEMLGEATHTGLRQDGHAVDWVRDGEQAKSALHAVEYEAVVLDLGLPRTQWIDVLRWLRASGHRAIVIIVTARDLIADRIAGLDAGADDYLIKPFDLDELSARLRAVQRRAESRLSDQLDIGPIHLDLQRKRVFREGREVDLTAREFAVLERLVRVAGRVLPRDELEECLYGFGEEISSNTVEVFIHHLRRKLGEDFIVTVRGRGYRVASE
ncbi:MAG: response regulator transcription factor [Proteobacteria bacterium]|nr:response regulator transcription factor [Pseudomonadota bacterium]